jgi:glycosyltransferase involved in cell wall biosynthesis
MNSLKRPIKILISCFAVSPNKGSEAGLGWNICNRISSDYNAIVLYGCESRTFHRDYSIEEYYQKNGRATNLKFIWIEPTKRAKLFLKIHDRTNLKILYYVAYRIWQKQAFVFATSLNKKENFDLVHQFNMIGFREPGFLWRLNLPFVWGPIGGTVNISLKYWSILGLIGSFKALIRNIGNSVQLNFSSRVHKAAQAANIMIAASTSEKRNLEARFKGKSIIVINETGCSDPLKFINEKSSDTLKLVWSGTHTPGKALPFLLYALAGLNKSINYSLEVLGTGTETNKWRGIAKRLGLGNKINWRGWLERNSALQIMKQSDILVFTSLKEGTPHVVLEALSLGLPVITLNTCGMGDVVNSKSGIKIELKSSSEIIQGISFAIEKLYFNENELVNLKNGALKRASENDWLKKAQGIEKVYSSVLTSNVS